MCSTVLEYEFGFVVVFIWNVFSWEVETIVCATLLSSVVRGVVNISEVFEVGSLMVVSAISDVNPVAAVSIGMLSLVERGDVSPSVYPGAFNKDAEDGSAVETASFVALIDIAPAKAFVLPVKAEHVSGYGSICTMKICLGLSAP